MAHLGDSGKTELIVLLDKGGKGGKNRSQQEESNPANKQTLSENEY